jgi:hypothetical protein
VADVDAIEAKITLYAELHPVRWQVRIGDDAYVFPPGTTEEEAQSVLDEAKARYLKEREEKSRG